MSDLLHSFRKYWLSQFSHISDARILLAVSGGADSMAMAHLFLSCGIKFGVAHCNFGLRAAAADMDEALVADWCIENNIQFFSIKFATKEKAVEWKKGTQETARILRYEWFETTRKTHGYDRIATAHHANDNVETVLINLFKGTGIQGMHGILPENGFIIRPLLFATRQVLDEYITKYEVSFREDASNKSDDYLRNAVRHHLVPAAEQLFSNAVNQANESIFRFGEAEQLYKQAINIHRKQLLELRGKDYYIPVRKLRLRKPLHTICYELLHPFGFLSAQLPHIINLLSAESGHFVSSATHRVIRNRDFLVITANAAQEADLLQITELPFEITTTTHVYKFKQVGVPKNLASSADVAYIDAADVILPLTLRKWRTGDYFYPLGMNMKKKKVSKLLIDNKVPLHKKEQLRILESGKKILWVAGIRLDERCKIKLTTTSVIEVTVTEL